jgi:hypothetical protein
MKRIVYNVIFTAFLAFVTMACEVGPPSSDQVQRAEQEKILKEATAQTGMPAIVNFRERKLLKDILELRDQDGLVTWTYTFSEQTGKYMFFCDSIGYGIPYATQYTNPEKEIYHTSTAITTLPQADPNGLFSPAAAEGTWVMCKNPNGPEVRPIYVEPRVIVSPFKLNESR